MHKFTYSVNWYPYSSYLWAKNYKDAWKKLKKMYPEYNVKKCIELSR